MPRFLFFVFCALMLVGLRAPAVAQAGAAGLPPRPVPFRFVNDQARLLAPADAKRLESGLRRYADTTGTQVVVVTVPTLGGRPVADYGRALGEAWGVGQRSKNNGIVVLLGAREHQVTIQPGSGLQGVITPEVTSRVIAQMTPGFKQGNYFAGLRKGLSALMLAANPSSNPNRSPAGAPASIPAAAGSAGPTGTNSSDNAAVPAAPLTNDPIMARPAPEPASPGFGLGGLLLGALVVGGGLWLLLRLFRGRRAASAPTAAPPDFLPNRPAGPAGYGPGPAGGGYGGAPGVGGGGGGMGVGGMLATGAAAAAGAYLGNRMASGHDSGAGNGLNADGTAPRNLDPNPAAGPGAGATGTGAADDYFGARNAGADSPAPDYFSDENVAADSAPTDYFSADDNSSYDDTSSDDTGGGGFDSDSDNSGSW